MTDFNLTIEHTTPCEAGEDVWFSLGHEITVEKLRGILSQLRDDDLLLPNRVQNLTIIRGGCYIGFINLQKNLEEVEIFEEKEL